MHLTLREVSLGSWVGRRRGTRTTTIYGTYVVGTGSRSTSELYQSTHHCVRVKRLSKKSMTVKFPSMTVKVWLWPFLTRQDITTACWAADKLPMILSLTIHNGLSEVDPADERGKVKSKLKVMTVMPIRRRLWLWLWLLMLDGPTLHQRDLTFGFRASFCVWWTGTIFASFSSAWQGRIEKY